MLTSEVNSSLIGKRCSSNPHGKGFVNGTIISIENGGRTYVTVEFDESQYYLGFNWKRGDLVGTSENENLGTLKTLSLIK